METSDAADVANKVPEPAFIEENHTKEPSTTDLNNIESISSTVPPEPEDNETQIEIQHPALQDNENKTQGNKEDQDEIRRPPEYEDVVLSYDTKGIIIP